MKGSLLILTSIVLILILTLIPIYTRLSGTQYVKRINIEEISALRAVHVSNIIKKVLETTWRFGFVQALYKAGEKGGCSETEAYWYNVTNTKAIDRENIAFPLYLKTNNTNPSICIPRVKELREIVSSFLENEFPDKFVSNNVEISFTDKHGFIHPEFTTDINISCDTQRKECRINITSPPEGLASNKSYQYVAEDDKIYVFDDAGNIKLVGKYMVPGGNDRIWNKNIFEKHSGIYTETIQDVTFFGISPNHITGGLALNMSVKGSKIVLEEHIVYVSDFILTNLPKIFRDIEPHESVIEEIVNNVSEIGKESKDKYQPSDTVDDYIKDITESIKQKLKNYFGDSFVDDTLKTSIHGYPIEVTVESIRLFVPDINDKLIGNQSGLIAEYILKFKIKDKISNFYWDGTSYIEQPLSWFGKTKDVFVALNCSAEMKTMFNYKKYHDLACGNDGKIYTCQTNIDGLTNKLSEDEFIRFNGDPANCEKTDYGLNFDDCYLCVEKGSFCNNNDIRKQEVCCTSFNFIWTSKFCKGDNFCDTPNEHCGNSPEDCSCGEKRRCCYDKDKNTITDCVSVLKDAKGCGEIQLP